MNDENLKNKSGFCKFICEDLTDREMAVLNAIVSFGSLVLAVSALNGNLSKNYWPWFSVMIALIGCLSYFDALKKKVGLLGALFGMVLLLLTLMAVQ